MTGRVDLAPSVAAVELTALLICEGCAVSGGVCAEHDGAGARFAVIRPPCHPDQPGLLVLFELPQKCLRLLCRACGAEVAFVQVAE